MLVVGRVKGVLAVALGRLQDAGSDERVHDLACHGLTVVLAIAAPVDDPGLLGRVQIRFVYGGRG